MNYHSALIPCTKESKLLYFGHGMKTPINIDCFMCPPIIVKGKEVTNKENLFVYSFMQMFGGKTTEVFRD